MILSVLIGSFSSFAQSNNALIGKAKGALKAECGGGDVGSIFNGGEINASVSVVSACFVDGFITEVTLWQTPNCPPNQACIQVVRLLGTVTFDCDNRVLSVDCGTRPITLD